MRVGTNDVIIDCGDDIRVLERTHGGFRKNALRKYHHAVMTKSCNGFMPIHTLERLLSLPVKAFAVRAAELRPRMIAAVHG
jgi:hypothetical protein